MTENNTIQLTERDANWIANRLVDFSLWIGVPLNQSNRLFRMARKIDRKIQKTRIRE